MEELGEALGIIKNHDMTYNERLFLQRRWEVTIKGHSEVARVMALIGHDAL